MLITDLKKSIKMDYWSLLFARPVTFIWGFTDLILARIFTCRWRWHSGRTQELTVCFCSATRLKAESPDCCTCEHTLPIRALYLRPPASLCCCCCCCWFWFCSTTASTWKLSAQERHPRPLACWNLLIDKVLSSRDQYDQIQKEQHQWLCFSVEDEEHLLMTDWKPVSEVLSLRQELHCLNTDSQRNAELCWDPEIWFWFWLNLDLKLLYILANVH